MKLLPPPTRMTTAANVADKDNKYKQGQCPRRDMNNDVHSLKFNLFISIFWLHPRNCCHCQQGGRPQLPTLPTRTTNMTTATAAAASMPMRTTTAATKMTLAAPAAADANEDNTDGHHLLKMRDGDHFMPSVKMPSVSCFKGNIIYFILVNVIIFSLI